MIRTSLEKKPNSFMQSDLHIGGERVHCATNRYSKALHILSKHHPNAVTFFPVRLVLYIRLKMGSLMFCSFHNTCCPIALDAVKRPTRLV